MLDARKGGGGTKLVRVAIYGFPVSI